jgi:hypothetical protein
MESQGFYKQFQNLKFSNTKLVFVNFLDNIPTKNLLKHGILHKSLQDIKCNFEQFEIFVGP